MALKFTEKLCLTKSSKHRLLQRHQINRNGWVENVFYGKKSQYDQNSFCPRRIYLLTIKLLSNTGSKMPVSNTMQKTKTVRLTSRK